MGGLPQRSDHCQEGLRMDHLTANSTSNALRVA